MDFRKVYRQTITDREWKLPFGKWKGTSIGELIDIAPEYIEWLISKDMIDLDHKLLDELEERNPWMAKD